MKDSNQISMVVFDWAGTTVDYGSCAPMDVFKMVFDEAGVNLSRQEINGPMGLEKKTHIRSLLSLENANKQWLATCIIGVDALCYFGYDCGNLLLG